MRLSINKILAKDEQNILLMNLWERLQYDWKRGSVIVQLIFINVAVFIFANVILGIIDLMPQLRTGVYFFDWFSLSSDPKQLLYHPWSLITYGFLHKSLWHILFNMLWLYWIGSILVEYLGNRKVLPIYLYGILAGGLLFLLFFNFQVSATHTLIGASAGVMAVVWATVALLPDYRINLLFIGSIPLIYVAAFLSILDLFSITSSNNAGGAVAHIGGALMGYFFIKLYQNRGIDLSIGFNKIFDRITTLFYRPKSKSVHVSYRNKNVSNKAKHKKSTVLHDMDQEEQLNSILDKINESGYNSLSKEEKEFLFKRSN